MFKVRRLKLFRLLEWTGGEEASTPGMSFKKKKC
jgi:hypothetical protein